MSDEEQGLPKNFDVVIIGTGITESIVSAAVSRNGHTVLHLDPREYYASFWATLNFKDWLSKDFATIPQNVSNTEFSSEDRLAWRNCCQTPEDVWYSHDEIVQDNQIKCEFEKNSRQFNIDVFPQVVLARDELIELLISSNVSRYLEFLRVGKLFTNLPHPNQDVIESIPLSRSDIFTSKSIGLAEKRVLVKFIEAILKPLENEETSETSNHIESFEELVQNHNLSSKIAHLMRNAVEILEDGFKNRKENDLNLMFVARCKKYLESIGRFGNQTPYLWPLYGISEICQAFCRLSAVYGGLFILNRFISCIEECEEGLKIKSENDQFVTKHLVVGPELKFVNHSSARDDEEKVGKVVGRGVIIIDGNSLKIEQTKVNAKEEGILFYKIGQLQVIELHHHSQSVQKNYKLLQITFACNNNDETSPRQIIEDTLQPFVNFDQIQVNDIKDASVTDKTKDLSEQKNTNSSKPNAIYGSYFLINFFADKQQSNDKIHSCTIDSTDLTAHILKAKAIFSRIYPEEEFLPKVPDQGEMAAEHEEEMETESDTQNDNACLENLNPVIDL